MLLMDQFSEHSAVKVRSRLVQFVFSLISLLRCCWSIIFVIILRCCTGAQSFGWSLLRYQTNSVELDEETVDEENHSRSETDLKTQS